jgi:hypothetical protein
MGTIPAYEAPIRILFLITDDESSVGGILIRILPQGSFFVEYPGLRITANVAISFTRSISFQDLRPSRESEPYDKKNNGLTAETFSECFQCPYRIRDAFAPDLKRRYIETPVPFYSGLYHGKPVRG